MRRPISLTLIALGFGVTVFGLHPIGVQHDESGLLGTLVSIVLVPTGIILCIVGCVSLLVYRNRK